MLTQIAVLVIDNRWWGEDMYLTSQDSAYETVTRSSWSFTWWSFWSDMVPMGFVWSSRVHFVTFVVASKGGWVLLGRQCNRDKPSCLSPSDMQGSGCTLFTSWQRVQRTRILSPVCFPWPEVITKYTSVPCCRSQLSKDGWMSKDGTHPFQRLHRAVLDGCAALVRHLNHTLSTRWQQDTLARCSSFIFFVQTLSLLCRKSMSGRCGSVSSSDRVSASSEVRMWDWIVGRY